MQQYHFVDKTGWLPGPWMSEPDKIQWVDKTSGYPVIMKRHARMGHWCGYVGIPELHPLFGKGWIDDAIGGLNGLTIHGGITYAEACDEQPIETAVCHKQAPGEPDVWWLGFDCCHCNDWAPGYQYMTAKSARDMGMGPPGDIYCPGETYRDVAFVKGQIRKLARQLARLA